MIKRSTSNSPPLRPVELQQARPNSVAVTGTLESLVRSLHAQESSPPSNERNDIQVASVETVISESPAPFMLNATALGNGLSAEIQKSSDEVTSKTPASHEGRPSSSSHLDVSDYQDLLKVEEAVTCSKQNSTYDLIIVRNFLVELVSRVQRSLKKTLVSWESVRKRFYDMMTGDDCPDIDLLGRYQTQMYFFQYSLDEKVLEEWTGKKTVVEVFALPEFEGLKCFREANPPHDLFVMVEGGLPGTHSIAVDTEDLKGYLSSPTAADPFDLLELSSCTEEPLIPIPVNGIENGVLSPSKSAVTKSKFFSVDDGIEPCELNARSSNHLTDAVEAQLNSSGSTEQSNEVFEYNALPTSSFHAPQPSDLPDPCFIFEEICLKGFPSPEQSRSSDSNSSESGGRLKSTDDHLSTTIKEGMVGEELLIQLSAEDTSSRNRSETAFLLTPDMSPVEQPLETHSAIPQQSLEMQSTVPQKDSSSSTDNVATENLLLIDNHRDPTKPEVALDPVKMDSHKVQDQEVLVKSSSPGTRVCENTEESNDGSPSDADIELLKQAEIFPLDMLQTTAGLPEENVMPSLENATIDVPCLPVKSTPSCFRVSQVEASLESPPSQGKVTSDGNTSVPQDTQPNHVGSSVARSVLDGLNFPDINGDVIKYLTYIREQVLDHHKRQKIIPRLENILSSLNETISTEWIDYVLCYISDVGVYPVEGQVFLAWKGK